MWRLILFLLPNDEVHIQVRDEPPSRQLDAPVESVVQDEDTSRLSTIDEEPSDITQDSFFINNDPDMFEAVNEASEHVLVDL